MARNGSGTASVINTFSPSTTISSSAVNANFSDIAADLTNSLALDGQSSMTGQFKAASGTAATPGMGFAADTNTGFYRKGSDNVGAAAGGSDIWEWTTSGIVMASGKTITGTDIIDTTQLKANSVTLAKLATQADATILANVSGGAAVPTAATLTSVIDKLYSTQGGLLYRGAASWAGLAAGTSGQFLKTQGAGANPTWASISEVPDQTGASGKVLTTNGTSASWSGNAIFAKGTFTGAATPVVTGASNVASVTRIGTGIYEVTMTTACANANYQVCGQGYNTTYPGGLGFSVTSKSTTKFRIFSQVATIGYVDGDTYDFIVVGGF